MIAHRDDYSSERLPEIKEGDLEALFQKALSSLSQEQKQRIRETLTIRFEPTRKSIETGKKSEYSANGNYNIINYAKTRLEKQLAGWEKALS